MVNVNTELVRILNNKAMNHSSPSVGATDGPISKAVTVLVSVKLTVY